MCRNTIRDGGSTALNTAYTLDTVEMVYTADLVYTVYMVYTIDMVYITLLTGWIPLRLL